MPEAAAVVDAPKPAPAAAKPVAEAAPAAATPAPAAAPAVTLETLKVPEGLPEAHVADFRKFAAEHKADPVLAQKLLDREASILSAQVAAAQEHVAENMKALEAAAQADPEVGGLKYEQNVARADRMLDVYFGPVAEQLRAEGWHKHPEILRGLVKLAAALGEPGPVKSNSPAPAAKSYAASNFPISVAQGFPE